MIGLLQQQEAEEALTPAMQDIWHRLRQDTTEYAVDWDKMYGVISGRKKGGWIRRAGNAWYKVAAVLVLVFAVSAAWWAMTGKSSRSVPRELAAGRQVGTGVAGKASADRRRIIHLPDGSTVILNANSKLDYPAVFGGSRDVYLTGEGYFDIVRDPGKPFFVHTGTIVTVVLGTAFDIRAYPADGGVQVTVTKGRVRVLKAGKDMGLLTANQQISYKDSTGEYLRRRVDPRPIVAWKPEEIRFEDLSMEEAVTRIGQRSKMRVAFVNPAIRNCHITATFYEDDMLQEILTVICGVSQSNFTIRNNTIIIDGKGCD